MQQLVDALEAGTLAAPDPLNLGLTPEMNRRLSDRVVTDTPEILPAQKDLLTRSFRDTTLVNRVLQGLYGGFVFDDYPEVRIRVRFSDKTELMAVSNSPSEFMLPWRIGPAEIRTFRADISRGAAAVMPPGMLNRDRLRGTGFTRSFIEALRDCIEPEWNLADAEHRAGPTLAALRKHYTIESAEIHGSHHPEYGEEWRSGKPSEVNLHMGGTATSIPVAIQSSLQSSI